MKPPAPLVRRTALKRSTKPLKRTELPRRSASPARQRQANPPKARKAPRSSSVRRRADPKPIAIAKDMVRREVFARDGHRCRLSGVPGAGKCHGRLTYHHRRKGGQGGGYTVENGATLCVRHNDELEADADLALLARTMGLVLKRGDEWTPTLERFWSKVDRDGPVPEHAPELGPCWLWRGKPNVVTGYGYFFPVRGHAMLAHRYALGYLEPLIPGLEVDHRCRRRICVNPRHLEQVTGAVNRRRQAEAQPPPMTCGKGHPIDGTQLGTRVDGNPVGLCLTCRRKTRRDYYHRQREKEADAELRADRQGPKGQRAPHEEASPQAPSSPAGRRAGAPGTPAPRARGRRARASSRD